MPSRGVQSRCMHRRAIARRDSQDGCPHMVAGGHQVMTAMRICLPNCHYTSTVEDVHFKKNLELSNLLAVYANGVTLDLARRFAA